MTKAAEAAAWMVVRRSLRPGRPIAHWRSTTRDAASGEPRHAESGFLRVNTDGVELVVAHSFGIVEATSGSFDGALLEVRSSGMLGTASAKRVDEVERSYRLDGDSLEYEIAMAAVGLPLTHHRARKCQSGR